MIFIGLFIFVSLRVVHRRFPGRVAEAAAGPVGTYETAAGGG
jgi:hypothetical protein